MRKATNGRRLYPLGDTLTNEEQKRFGCTPLGTGLANNGTNGTYVLAISPENRKVRPRSGDWYLSGAVPAAYRARADLSSEYIQLQLVRVRKVDVPTEEIIE